MTKILVIDDDAAVRQTLGPILENAGYEGYSAPTMGYAAWPLGAMATIPKPFDPDDLFVVVEACLAGNIRVRPQAK